MNDKELRRAIENQEAFSKNGEPNNAFRERHGLPSATKEDVQRFKKIRLRWSRMKNKKGWINS